ncbi:unnamed protein product [Allacma fusca]|uniref:Uncharacterized protein n=1 Tax=Allacma fusca TaxID=39272 RepID=A0A8J2KH55_9HEXA|nr:unnamed protein product [Allacma fusca]
MLTKSEVRLNFKILKILTHLYCLPIEISVETGKIRIGGSRKKILSFVVLEILKILHAMLLDQNSKRPWRAYSFTELLTITLPILMTGATFGMLPVYILKPNSSFFLYSLVPEGSQNWLVLTAIISLDFYLWVYYLAIIMFVTFLQLSFFQRVNSLLKEKLFLKQIEPGPHNILIVNQNLKLIRKIHSSVHHYNLVFAGISFNLKCTCIISAIVELSFAVKYFSVSPVEGLANFLLGINSMVIYPAIYNNCFRIPEQVPRLKKQIRVRSRSLPSKISITLARQELEALPNLGIKDGSFRTFQKSSTPIFVDFVIQNVVALLISFHS